MADLAIDRAAKAARAKEKLRRFQAQKLRAATTIASLALNENRNNPSGAVGTSSDSVSYAGSNSPLSPTGSMVAFGKVGVVESHTLAQSPFQPPSQSKVINVGTADQSTSTHKAIISPPPQQNPTELLPSPSISQNAQVTASSANSLPSQSSASSIRAGPRGNDPLPLSLDLMSPPRQLVALPSPHGSTPPKRSPQAYGLQTQSPRRDPFASPPPLRQQEHQRRLLPNFQVTSSPASHPSQNLPTQNLPQPSWVRETNSEPVEIPKQKIVRHNVGNNRPSQDQPKEDQAIPSLSAAKKDDYPDASSLFGDASSLFGSPNSGGASFASLLSGGRSGGSARVRRPSSPPKYASRRSGGNLSKASASKVADGSNSPTREASSLFGAGPKTGSPPVAQVSMSSHHFDSQFLDPCASAPMPSARIPGIEMEEMLEITPVQASPPAAAIDGSIFADLASGMPNVETNDVLTSQQQTIALLVADKNTLTARLADMEKILIEKEDGVEVKEKVMKELKESHEESGYLKDDIIQKERNIQNMAEQMTKLKREAEVSNHTNSELQAQLINRDAILHSKDEQLSEMHSSSAVSDLEDRLRAKSDHANGLELELSKARAAAAKFKGDYDLRELDHLAVKQNRAEIKSRMEQILIENRSSVEALEKTTVELADLREKKVSDESIIAALRASLSSLSAKMKSTEELLASSEGRMSALEEIFLNAEKKTQAVSTRRDGLQKENTDLMASLEELRGKVVLLSNVHASQADSNALLERTILQKDLELAACKVQLQDVGNDEEAFYKLKVEHETLLATSKEGEKSHSGHHELVLQLQRELAAAHGETSHLRTREELFDVKLESMRQNYSNLSSAHDTLQKDHDSHSAQVERMHKDHKKELESLQQDLEIAQRYIKESKISSTGTSENNVTLRSLPAELSEHQSGATYLTPHLAFPPADLSKSRYNIAELENCLNTAKVALGLLSLLNEKLVSTEEILNYSWEQIPNNYEVDSPSNATQVQNAHNHDADESLKELYLDFQRNVAAAKCAFAEAREAADGLGGQLADFCNFKEKMERVPHSPPLSTQEEKINHGSKILEEELHASKAKVADLLSFRELQKTDLATLRESLAEKDQRFSDFEIQVAKELEAANQLVRERNIALAASVRRASQSERELNALMAINGSGQSEEVKVLRSTIANLHSDAARLRSNAETAEEEIARLTEQIDDTMAEREAYADSLKSKELQIQRLTGLPASQIKSKEADPPISARKFDAEYVDNVQQEHELAISKSRALNRALQERIFLLEDEGHTLLKTNGDLNSQVESMLESLKMERERTRRRERELDCFRIDGHKSESEIPSPVVSPRSPILLTDTSLTHVFTPSEDTGKKHCNERDQTEYQAPKEYDVSRKKSSPESGLDPIQTLPNHTGVIESSFDNGQVHETEVQAEINEHAQRQYEGFNKPTKHSHLKVLSPPLSTAMPNIAPASSFALDKDISGLQGRVFTELANPLATYEMHEDSKHKTLSTPGSLQPKTPISASTVPSSHGSRNLQVGMNSSTRHARKQSLTLLKARMEEEVGLHILQSPDISPENLKPMRSAVLGDDLVWCAQCAGDLFVV